MPNDLSPHKLNWNAYARLTINEAIEDSNSILKFLVSRRLRLSVAISDIAVCAATCTCVVDSFVS